MKIFICVECLREFTNFGDLDRHIESEHGSDEDDE